MKIDLVLPDLDLKSPAYGLAGNLGHTGRQKQKDWDRQRNATGGNTFAHKGNWKVAIVPVGSLALALQNGKPAVEMV